MLGIRPARPLLNTLLPEGFSIMCRGRPNLQLIKRLVGSLDDVTS